MSLHKQVGNKKTQNEMRRLMAERKNKEKKPTQINNPLAKYNNSGQLTCVLCLSIVRSEHVWQIHINSKQHKENVEKAKRLKELTNNFTDGKKSKRVGMAITDGPDVKKIKGILKNATEPIPNILHMPKNDAPTVYSFHDEEINRKIVILQENNEQGQCDKPSNAGIEESSTDVQENEDAPDLQAVPNVQPIPEGFFDDPILDAKARNIEYKDPIEEEWEKFQKQIKEETTTSAEIIAGEQEEATAERQIDEIDEQIRNWSRVLDLELKKEETKKKIHDIEMLHDKDDESDNETEIDEFLDWRAKKSYS